MAYSIPKTKEMYCDEPMARSKGLIGSKETTLPRCKKDCKNCIACIKINASGDREHVTPKVTRDRI